MPKDRVPKKGAELRHNPLGSVMEKPSGKLRAPRATSLRVSHMDLDNDGEEEELPAEISAKIYSQARSQRQEMASTGNFLSSLQSADEDRDDDADIEEEQEYDEDEYPEQLIEFNGDFVADSGISEAEEAVIGRFLQAGRMESKTLADIIMEKIRERDDAAAQGDANEESMEGNIPPKVMEVYTSVGKMLQHYKSGKLPKALKMLPHLKNWEDVLWLTRPDEWSACATYACTRIFSSNLNAKMAQRFYNLVLLEKCRYDIQKNKTLNYHLYMALKKALFKPAAFYKGVLLPLAQSRTCTLREATIIGSVLLKVSIPGAHSAAALLRLTELPYTGSTSLFIRVLLSKKYALPRRVVDALVDHFASFEGETRELPVIWHQSLLTFAQRYKLALSDDQKDKMKSLLRVHVHHKISLEVRREIFSGSQGQAIAAAVAPGASGSAATISNAPMILQSTKW